MIVGDWLQSVVSGLLSWQKFRPAYTIKRLLLPPIISTGSPMPSENSQSASALEDREFPQKANEQRQLPAICWSPFGRTLFSGVLLWLAFPPVGLFWLAWLAPVPLLSLIIGENQEIWRDRQSFLKRPLMQVWWASLIFWLVTFYFIPYPHPILIIGWLALSAYLAVYTPLMLQASHTMIVRWKVSPLVAIPIAWTGLEWIRINFLTGFGMVALSHSQYSSPLLIQIADLSGAYTVTFAMTTFAAAATYCCYKSHRLGGVIGCVVMAALVVGYGTVRLNQRPPALSGSSNPTETIALIQTSIDTILKPKPESQILDELSHLRDINWAARQANDSIDLIVWPESSYPYGNYVADDDDHQGVLISRSNLKQVWSELTHSGDRFPAVPTIIGTSTIDLNQQTVFNSAILLDEKGLPVGRYDKNHRVMFGEYVPLLEYFPALMHNFPLLPQLNAGTEARLFESGSLRIAPNVCFESTVPHLIRRQLNSISVDQGEPDALLNVTNDGWFFGTSCLDLHYACNVFRAVELRKPMLVCANTGLSGHIDPWGIAIVKGTRRTAEFLICAIDTDAEFPSSPYRRMGDAIPMLLAIISIAALVARRGAGF